jgi:hypothetical protein
MADTPEKKMKKRVDAVLKEFGIWFFAPQSGIYGRSGIPDRVGILPGGRTIAVEVKAGSRYGLTDLQIKTMNEMERAGAACFVVRDDTTLAGLRAWLKLMGPTPKC